MTSAAPRQCVLAFAGDPGTAAEPPGESAASGAVVAALARYAVVDMPAQPDAAAVEPPESDAVVPDVEAFADAVPASVHSMGLQPVALAAGAYQPAFVQEADVVLVSVAPAFSLHHRQKVLLVHAHPAGDFPAL